MYLTISAFLLATLFVSASAFAAPAARIRGEDADGKKISIVLDAKGSPRVQGSPRSNPTIKDFREDGAVANYCFEGSEREVRKILTALVQAANGDGDSWADLRKITRNARGLVVSADIIDEGGKREENYLITHCK